MAEAKSDTRRLVSKKWYLGETLGKGAYGFVKCGYHIKNNKPFALKFMRKAGNEDSWAADQASMVATEINSLQKISNSNVLKLFAYNLRCAYPNKDGTSFDTVLLVLELAQGGELFDILYYTSKLPIPLAQTYFYQLMNGLQAIHDAGICHRDLKPQNLLLNKHFVLKITDFGLAKIFDPEKRSKVMETTCVGTKGYQAPELLLKRKYTEKCDIFAAGVILFIMLTGYPPFEEATATDSWYRKICQKKFNSFWDKHRDCGVPADDSELKELIQNCIAYQPSERYTCENAKGHSWCIEAVNAQDLEQQMRQLHSDAIKAKKQDARKMDQLAQSAVNNHRAGVEDQEIPVVEALACELNGLKVFSLSKDGMGSIQLLMDSFEHAVKEMKGHCKAVEKTDPVTGDVSKSSYHFTSNFTIGKRKAVLEFRLFKAKEGDEEILAYVNLSEDDSKDRSLGKRVLEGVLKDIAWALDGTKTFETEEVEYTDEDFYFEDLSA